MDERIKELPKITFDDFKKLIPMFLSDDSEIDIRTWIISNIRLFRIIFTARWIYRYFHPKFEDFYPPEIDKNPELDGLCKLHLTQAFRIKLKEFYLRWLNAL